MPKNYLWHFIAMFLLWGLAGYIAPSHASWIDWDNKSHRIEWTYFQDQSTLGAEAYSLYKNFGSVSLDGSRHDYMQAKYKPKHTDVGLGFTSTVFANDNTALLVITNFHTGQSSEKLTVAPSLQLGVKLYQVIFDRLESSLMISMNFMSTLGGRMKEKACTDNLDRVFNCRTAQSVVDTPLINKNPYNQHQVGIQLVWRKDFL